MPANVSATGIPAARASVSSACVRLAVEHPAPRDDQRALRAADELSRLRDPARVGERPLDPPLPLLEEALGVVEGVRLHVLGEREHDGAGLDGRREDPHRLRERGQELLRARDPVEEAGHGAEAVVDGDVARGGMLELLQHRPLMPRRIDVAGQEQEGEPVDRRAGGGRDHVRRAGPDRRGAGERLTATGRLREGGRGVRHRLLVAALVERQAVAMLLDRLPEPDHVAVAEDPPDPGDQPPAVAVPLGPLRLEVANHCLRGRESHRVYPSTSRSRGLRISSRPAADVHSAATYICMPRAYSRRWGSITTFIAPVEAIFPEDALPELRPLLSPSFFAFEPD